MHYTQLVNVCSFGIRTLFAFMFACSLRLFFIQGHCHVIANNLYFTAFNVFCLCYWHRFNALSIYFCSSRFLIVHNLIYSASCFFSLSQKAIECCVVPKPVQTVCIVHTVAQTCLYLASCESIVFFIGACNTCTRFWAPILWLSGSRS